MTPRREKQEVKHLSCKNTNGFTVHLCKVEKLKDLVLDEGDYTCGCSKNLLKTTCADCWKVYGEQVLKFLKDTWCNAKEDWSPDLKKKQIERSKWLKKIKSKPAVKVKYIKS